jgi:NTE family protein
MTNDSSTLPPPVPPARAGQVLALTLMGGGARGAYQAGVLERLGQALPELQFPIVTGVSAGAINAAYLANSLQAFGHASRGLSGLWAGLTTHQVVRDAPLELLRNVVRWSSQLLSGGGRALSQARGLLDTTPLHSLLERELPGPEGTLSGVARKLAAGRLSALAITTTDYGDGHAITFAQQTPGHHASSWTRPQRIGVEATIGIQHVMASAAIPLLFPAVSIGGRWHGDGSVRDTAPLSPALHLGADRILVISTVRGPTRRESPAREPDPYPSLARIIGVTLNSLLYGNADHDVAQMQRFTELARICPTARAAGLRAVEVMVLRPSDDLGEMAMQYEKQLPRAIRYLTRGLGTSDPRSGDLLSTLLFESTYTQRLIECGRRDAERRLDQLHEFLTGSGTGADTPARVP